MKKEFSYRAERKFHEIPLIITAKAHWRRYSRHKSR